MDHSRSQAGVTYLRESYSEEGKYNLLLQKKKCGLQKYVIYLHSALGKFCMEKCPVLDMTLQERCSLTEDSLVYSNVIRSWKG